MNNHRDNSRVVIGVFIILVGVLALMNNLFNVNTGQIMRFWPVVFMVLGALRMANARHTSGYVFGGGLMLLGALLTASAAGWLTVSMRDLWPLFLIVAGLVMVTRTQTRRNRLSDNQTPGLEDSSDVSALAVMSGHKIRSASQDFKRAEVSAFMGGAELDLRNASIQGDAVVSVFAMWGGLVLKVPTDWSVIVNATAIMGEVADKTVPPLAGSKRLIIEGFVLMGGVEIRN